MYSSITKRLISNPICRSYFERFSRHNVLKIDTLLLYPKSIHKKMNHRPPPPIALSAVFIVNLRGDVLIERQYRSDISRANIDMFKTEILSLSASSSSPFSGRKSNGSSRRNTSTSSKVDVQSLPPIRIVGQIRFMFIRVANVYVCAATKLNVNVSMCFAFLKSAIGTFQVRVELFFVLFSTFSRNHVHIHIQSLKKKKKTKKYN